MVTDANLATLRKALERLKAADAALDQGETRERWRELRLAYSEARRMNAALLPGLLDEIEELRRLVRLHVPEKLP